MRTHLFTGSRTMLPKIWHNEASKGLNEGHTWQEFCPYTNVLWLRFLLGYLKRSFNKSGGDADEMTKFEADTKELKTKLDPRTRITNGAFSSALEVFEYIAIRQWISQEQVQELSEQASFLSES